MLKELSGKGISREQALEQMERMDLDDAKSLGSQMDRYLRGKDFSDRSVRAKAFRYLYGKGYSAFDIQQAFSERGM